MRQKRLRRGYGCALLLLCGTVMPAITAATAQATGNAPVSVPAGADEPAGKAQQTVIAPSAEIPAKQAREAEDAYLEGAKQIERKDLAAAEKSFGRAVQLNPADRDYALALIVTREHHLSELVQEAAKARLRGDNMHADALLQEARKLDPDSAVIKQHYGDLSAPAVSVLPANSVAASLGSAVQLDPKPGKQDVHLRGAPREVLRSLYQQFGITASFDSSMNQFVPVKLDVEGVTFEQVARIAGEMTGTFAVPVQPHEALIATDTQENRDRLQPQVEETLYMPGLQETQMQEMANLARSVFDLRSVTASPSTDTIVLKGDPQSLKVLNATYDGMLNGSSDVLLDVKLYEMDRTNERNIGLQLPSSVGAFSVSAEAEQLVSANQSTISEAIAAGVIKLTGNSVTDLITEAGFLIESGVVSSTQFGNLLGLFGNGLTLSGLYLGSGSTFNLLLNSSDVRILDAVQLRSGNNQDATFRAGERYPIITSTYTTGVSSSVASAVSGLNINGTSVSSLLQQYLGTSSVTVPQIQYEDLGLTLKATPSILRSGAVQVKLDLKIESLGAASINNIPVLNSRQLTSIVVIPAGKSALLASLVSNSETKSVQGVPGLSELPGFQSTTNEDKQTSTGELLITITPHVVRSGGVRIASRPLLMPYNPHPSAQGFIEEPPPQQPAQPAQPTEPTQHTPGEPQNPLQPRSVTPAPGATPQPMTSAPQ